MKKKIILILFMATVLVIMPVLTIKTGNVTVSASDVVSQFMDCIQPMPIVEALSSNCWGSVVGSRDQGNGLEDRDNSDYCYWDGKILKDDSTGTYYLFASRWNEANGHNGWFGSNAVYATSKNLYGPYEDKGLLWPNDQGGKGHNVWPLKLHEGDPNGKYAIVVSETRGGDVFVSDSLDGPWKNKGSLKMNQGYWQSNTCVIARPDGKYEAINRNGEIGISDNLLGTYQVVKRDLWKKVRTMPTECIEDAVMWYSDGLYHITVNKWDSRNAYYLTSKNGIDDWVLMEGSAYQPDSDFLRYTDGTVNHWNKIERPNVYIENGKVRAMTFSVIDVPKDRERGKDSHGSKVIVVPFDGDALKKFDDSKQSMIKKEPKGIIPTADSNVQFYNNDYQLNFGKKNYMQLQRKVGNKYGLYGEKLKMEKDRWSSCKIGYMKFDISGYDLNKMKYAALSLVYIDEFGGNSPYNCIQVALAKSGWMEGNGNGSNSDIPKDSSVVWNNKPALMYNTKNINGTTVTSEKFATERNTDIGKEIEIDITSLLKQVDPSTKEVTFAICETVGDQRIAIGSKESGANAPYLNISYEPYDK